MAHQGRNLQIAKTWPERRIDAYPNESFTVKSNRLWCQCCKTYLKADKSSTVKRHLGLDAKQAAKGTNTGKDHKTALEKWNNRDNENEEKLDNTDYSDIKSKWVTACLINGLNASQTANLASDFFDRISVENSESIPKYVEGVTTEWNRCYENGVEKIKGLIDLTATYSVIIDETPDRWQDLSVTNILYSSDPTASCKTLEIQFRCVSPDNEGVVEISLKAQELYGLIRDNCSSINLDSTNYNITAFRKLQVPFRLAVVIFDAIHIFANGIKYGYQLDDWLAVKTWFTKSRSIFKNSLGRRRSLKQYLLARCARINDNGDLEHVFRSLSNREIEDILQIEINRDFGDEKEERDYTENVINALKREISYDTYPPKLIDGKFKSVSRCNLYFIHRFMDFRNWCLNIADIADNHYCKTTTDRDAQIIYVKIIFGQSYLSDVICGMYWFEKRAIRSHLAYSVIKRIIQKFEIFIGWDSISDNISALFDEWNWPQSAKNVFKVSCNNLRRFLLDYYNRNLSEEHPTMKFFKCCQWFNIDTIKVKPDTAEEATKDIPWGYKYFANDLEAQIKLEREWTGYLSADIPPREGLRDGINIYGDNGQRCLNFFESKRNEWELLVPIAVRSLKVVISTADVERIYSIYNYYLGQLDAVNLNVEHKRAKAFTIQNKQFI